MVVLSPCTARSVQANGSCERTRERGRQHDALDGVQALCDRAQHNLGAVHRGVDQVTLPVLDLPGASDAG
jgi:hypothetical protein